MRWALMKKGATVEKYKYVCSLRLIVISMNNICNDKEIGTNYDTVNINCLLPHLHDYAYRQGK